jgi:hypothetical protein
VLWEGDKGEVRQWSSLSARAANWMAIALLTFSAFSFLALIPPPDPDYEMVELAQTAARIDANGGKPTEAAISQYYELFRAQHRSLWLESIIFFCASVFAALVTFWRGKIGAWLVLLVCAYILYLTGPPFLRMSIDGGFMNFISVVVSTTMRAHGVPTGLLISWNLVVAPCAYALLALAAMYFLRQAHRERGA